MFSLYFHYIFFLEIAVIEDMRLNSNKYRKPNGGVYKNKVWEQRTYE